MSTNYRVTISKQEENGIPIITTYLIGKKTYEKILGLIIKTQGRK